MPRTVQLYHLTVTPAQLGVAAGLLIVLVAMVVAIVVRRRARARARRRRERTEAALADRTLAPFPPIESAPALPAAPPRPDPFGEMVYSEPARTVVRRHPDPDAGRWQPQVPEGPAARSEGGSADGARSYGEPRSDGGARSYGEPPSDGGAREWVGLGLSSDPDRTDRLPRNGDGSLERDTPRRDDAGDVAEQVPDPAAPLRQDAAVSGSRLGSNARDAQDNQASDEQASVEQASVAPASDEPASVVRNGQRASLSTVNHERREPPDLPDTPDLPDSRHPTTLTGSEDAPVPTDGPGPEGGPGPGGALEPMDGPGPEGSPEPKDVLGPEDARQPPARPDPKDRLLRVLLADPERALRAVSDLEACRAQLDRLNQSMRDQRRQLADAARRLRRAGLTPTQVAQLAGCGEAELASLLAEYAPSPAPRSVDRA